MVGDLGATVQAAQAGDEEAFRLLYRTLQPGLLRYLTALVGPEAEDVASETWLQIARDLHTFSDGGFRAWVVTIARHRALDYLRSQRRRPSMPVPVQELRDLPANADTAEGATEAIGTDTAIALIATLPPREAEAVLLRTVVGLDAEGAARVLGKRPGAVRTAAHRGLRRLAQTLEQYGSRQATDLAGQKSPTSSVAVPNPRPRPADDVRVVER